MKTHSFRTTRAFVCSAPSVSVVELTICARPQGKLSLGHVVTQKISDAEFKNGRLGWKGLQREKLFVCAFLNAQNIFSEDSGSWAGYCVYLPRNRQMFLFSINLSRRIASILHMCEPSLTQNLLAQALTCEFLSYRELLSAFLFLRILTHLLDTHKGLSTHVAAKVFTPISLPVIFRSRSNVNCDRTATNTCVINTLADKQTPASRFAHCLGASLNSDAEMHFLGNSFE